MSLAAKHCVPCEGGTPKMTHEAADSLLAESGLPWRRIEDTITRDFACKDFANALDLVNRIGAIAEAEDHHPDMLLHGYKNVRVTLSTHAIGGLSENDFIVAAKVEELDA